MQTFKCTKAIPFEYIKADAIYFYEVWEDGCVGYSNHATGGGSWLWPSVWAEAVANGSIVVLDEGDV